MPMSQTVKELILKSLKPYTDVIESVMVYTNPLKQRNMLIVFKNSASQDYLLDLRKLKKLKTQFREIKVFYHKEFLNALDVFPIEFSFIQKQHVVLLGRNIMDGLLISKDHLRHQCEFYLRSNLLTTRELYINKQINEKTIIQESFSQLTLVLEVIYSLLEINIEGEATYENIIEAVANRFSMQAHFLIPWLKAPDLIKKEDFENYSSFLTQLIACIDAL